MTWGAYREALTSRLVLVLISSLTAVALVLGVGGGFFSHSVAEQTGDRVLRASARAIAETLAVEGEEITLDLPAAAFGMLESNARDNIYYNIRHEGRLLTGYPDFPHAPSEALSPDRTHFRYDTFHGLPVRVATEVRSLPRVRGQVVVQIAETLDERRFLFSRMLFALAALEGVLVLMAGLLVWPAVSWSLRPMTRLRRELEARSTSGSDFTPLSAQAVPRELLGLVNGFNGLLSRLEKVMEGVRRFTADASHQMRTPLAVLQTHVAILREHGTETAIGRDSLEDIESAIGRLRRLLTQLIGLARAEENAAADKPPERRFNLSQVASEVARQIVPSALDLGVDVRFEDQLSAAWVRGDEMLAQEVVSNLLDNAVRYNRRGGVATVRIRAEDDVCHLEIEDDGPGIPAAEHQAVFQRFHRLARDQVRLGSGLGLPIVQTLTDAMGASVALDSGAGGRGLLVRVSFASAASPPLC